MSFFASVRNYIDGLVHPSARQDAFAAARHRAFIAPRLLGSLLALATFPVYLLLRGVPSLAEVGVFAWLIAPMLIACFLSRTGDFARAHVLSAMALTGLAVAVAWHSGGVTSFAAIWLVIVPLEAALSASRRVVALATVCAFGAAGLLLAATSTGMIPPVAPGAQTGALAALGIVAATLYATSIALGSESLARTGLRLRDAEEDRYRLLALNMTDVITRHGPNGNVAFVSPAAESLFGIRPDALLGHGLFDRVHVADRPAFLGALSDAAANDTARSVEFRARREPRHAAGGVEFIWLEMRCRPLDGTAGSGEPRQVVAILRDVSERKAQVAALEQARAESERANAGKGRFLATMSHELRTPLNAIIGFSEMLTDPSIALDAARRRNYAKLINDSGRHLLSVVNGILDMSKMEAGNFEITPEPFAPGPVIGGCCDILALKAQECGVGLNINLPRNLPEIAADRRALNQIMINLISNAIKFTERGGTVTVGAARDGVNLLITVADTGVGIGEDDLLRLGEAFFQARGSYDRRHDGTGLGLSIVKGLVRLHGGKMDIASRLGEGTCVTVRLPLECDGQRTPASPINFARRHSAPPDAADHQEQVKKRA